MPQLKNLEIDEVSLVDNPANPGAKVMIMKRNDELTNIIKSGPSGVTKREVFEALTRAAWEFYGAPGVTAEGALTRFLAEHPDGRAAYRIY